MSDSYEEATVNPDGSTTFEDTAGQESFNETGSDGAEEMLNDGEMEATGIDPAFYLLGAAAVIVLLVVLIIRRQREKTEDTDDFFSNLDGDKFNLKLPAAVDEYYAIKEKAIQSGWQPGQRAAPGTPPSGPHRVLAQALMKRCIADIPLVTHIQKESSGMNKLYSNSMCSVKQWRTYEAAEAMVSAEVDEVRQEADEIEPGWSGVIWRQAMQYHNMLKNKQEMEAKQKAALAEKKKAEEDKVLAEKRKVEAAEAKVLAAEKAAAELIAAEDREKHSKSAFSSKEGGMKKGFLNSGSAKKK